MQYIETIYLNADVSEIAKPESSDCVRFCLSTMYAHATIITQLSNVFNKAQLLWQEQALQGPYYVSIIFPLSLDHKRKPEDAETVYDRLKWYINNFRVPDCGMVISFYQNLNAKPWITTPWHLHEFWPMKRQWDPKGTHITIQQTEKLIGTSAKDIINSVSPGFIDRVVEQASKYGYQIKYLDYTTPFDQMYDDIVTSDHHFGYVGATYFFAATVGCPTTGWGYMVPAKNKCKGSYYEYNTVDDKPVRVYTDIQVTQWANLCTNKARIMQFDHDQQIVMNKPANYCTNVDNVNDINNVFTKMMTRASKR